MAINVIEKVGAVTRKISTREVNGQPARVLVAGRVYDTDQADLWDALTNIDRIPRWFMPITGDLRLGGHYQLEGNAGGEVIACERPHHFALTWGMGGSDSWVNIDLTPQTDGQTELRLEHIAHVPDEMWDMYGPGAVGVGWESGLLGMDQYLGSDVGITPEEGAAWMLSDEGREFVRRSSDAWAEAAIADGADPDAARAAAANTAAFYLGETTEQGAE